MDKSNDRPVSVPMAIPFRLAYAERDERPRSVGTESRSTRGELSCCLAGMPSECGQADAGYLRHQGMGVGQSQLGIASADGGGQFDGTLKA